MLLDMVARVVGERCVLERACACPGADGALRVRLVHAALGRPGAADGGEAVVGVVGVLYALRVAAELGHVDALRVLLAYPAVEASARYSAFAMVLLHLRDPAAVRSALAAVPRGEAGFGPHAARLLEVAAGRVDDAGDVARAVLAWLPPDALLRDPGLHAGFLVYTAYTARSMRPLAALLDRLPADAGLHPSELRLHMWVVARNARLRGDAEVLRMLARWPSVADGC